MPSKYLGIKSPLLLSGEVLAGRVSGEGLQLMLISLCMATVWHPETLKLNVLG